MAPPEPWELFPLERGSSDRDGAAERADGAIAAVVGEGAVGDGDRGVLDVDGAVVVVGEGGVRDGDPTAAGAAMAW